MLICAVDPGISTGVAFFRDRVLFRVEPLQEHTWVSIKAANRLVIEDVWWRGKEKNPQNLLTLAKRAGEYGGRYKALNPSGVLQYVFPHEYKAGLDKQVAWNRAVRLLNMAESEIWRTLKIPDLKDAIVIGLWAVGRK